MTEIDRKGDHLIITGMTINHGLPVCNTPMEASINGKIGKSIIADISKNTGLSRRKILAALDERGPIEI